MKKASFLDDKYDDYMSYLKDLKDSSALLALQCYKNYEEHKNIILGLDFDNTIFALDDSYKEVCTKVMDKLLDLKSKYALVICLFTVTDEQSLKYKLEILKSHGIGPHYINESPVKPHGDCKKPYFNLYLDDKAGLESALLAMDHLINLRLKS